MAIQILPGKGIGENLSEGLQGGLNQALGILIKNKLDALRGAQEYKTLQGLLGQKEDMPAQGYVRPGAAPQYARLALSQEKEARRQKERLEPLQLAAQNLPQIKELIASGALGSGIGALFPSEGKRQYESFLSGLKSSRDPVLGQFSDLLAPGQSQDVLTERVGHLEDYLAQKGVIPAPQSQEHGMQSLVPSGDADILQPLMEQQKIAQLQQPPAEKVKEDDEILTGIKQYLQEVSDLQKSVKSASEVPPYLAARAAVGAGKGITGLPAGVNKLLSFVTAGKIPVSSYLEKLENMPEDVLSKVLGEDVVKKAPEGWENVGEFAEDAAMLLSPGIVLKGANLLNTVGKTGKYLNAASKILDVSPKAALGISAAGNVPKWLAKKVGAPKGAQEAVKIGSTLAFSLLGPRLFKKQLESSYKKEIDNLESTVQQSYKDKPALKSIWDSLKDTDISKLSANDKQLFNAVTRDPSLSSYMNQYRNVKSEYDALKDLVNEGGFIGKWGSRSMMRRVGQGAFPAAAALVMAPGSFLKKAATFAGGAAVIKGLGEAEKVIKLAYKSPAFRNTYSSALQAIARQSFSEADKSLRRLDKIMKKEGISAPKQMSSYAISL